jgi:GNAT superfamily N-acetyltransferase
MGQVRIERAEPEDLVAIVEIFNDVLSWLVSIGMSGQWGTGPLPTDPDLLPDEWMQEIMAGEQYLASFEGRPIAALRVSFVAPTHEWGDVADDAGYVSRLVVRRDVSDRSVGLALLDWAGRWAVRHGKRRLRLSCWADNPRLCLYYLEAGFRSRGEYDYNEEWRGRLFEKQL